MTQIITKPIYQLYDEFVYHERVCKVCGYETCLNNKIEIHIREKHPEKVND